MDRGRNLCRPGPAQKSVSYPEDRGHGLHRSGRKGAFARAGPRPPLPQRVCGAGGPAHPTAGALLRQQPVRHGHGGHAKTSGDRLFPGGPGGLTGDRPSDRRKIYHGLSSGHGRRGLEAGSRRGHGLELSTE